MRQSPPITMDWEAVSREMPGLTVSSVVFLGEGWSSRAYLVNGELVFRFPRSKQAWLQLELEMEFLHDTGARLPLQVPQCRHLVPQSVAAPYGYGVSTYVPGSPLQLDVLSPEQQSAAADSIAEFLLALHQIDRGFDGELPRQAERHTALDLLQQAENLVIPQLSRERAARLREQFRKYLESDANFQFVPVVRHADFSADHILMVDKSVAGVIDFSDVSVGDPDYDFSYLLMDIGDAFAIDVARRYGHANLDLLKTKLQFFAVADFVDTIANGEGRASTAARELAWRRLQD